MKQARNTVFRVVFVLEFRGRERVKNIQDRTSAFANGRLHTVMIEGLTAMGNPEQTFFFDKVEFNVGEISLARLEDDLAAGIAWCLRQWVFQVRPLRPGPMLVFSRDAAASPAHDDSDVHHLLLEPSSSSKPRTAIVATRGLSAAVAAALRKPADWSEFMVALRDNHVLRTRLADEVSPKLLGRLVQSMSPTYGAAIMAFGETMLALYKRQPLASVSIYAFRRTLWECIFYELGRSPQAAFSLQFFARSVLKLMATRVSRSYSTFAADIGRLLEQHFENLPGATALKTALLDLDAQQANEAPSLLNGPQPLSEIPESSEPKEQAIASTSRRLTDLENFLLWGALPWTSSSITSRQMETGILDLLTAVPDEVCALIQRLSEMEPARKRLASQFSGQTMTRLLGRLAPTCANWMTSYMHQLRRLHAQKPLVNLRNREFTHLLSQLCFEYLMQQNWQSFTPQSFLQYLLRQLAARARKSYEVLLADVALRHQGGPNASHAQGAFALSTGLGYTLLILVDHAIVGLNSHSMEAPRFLVKPEFRSLYSDIDVLAYWLRWHKLPSWNQSTNADEIVQHIGPLLRALPAEIRDGTRKTSLPTGAAEAAKGSVQSPASPDAARQIEYWLMYGVWPEGVSASENSQLSAWLENQSDADWLKALEGRGAPEAIIERISRHLSTSFFARIAGLLSGQSSGLVHGYLHSLEIAGRRIAPMATPLWLDQLKRYTLIYLLRASSVSGRQTITALEFARNTMLALSLRCRLPYERLLNSVEKASHGQQDVQNLCHTLRQELEADELKIAEEEETFAETRELPSSALDSPDIVLHYLKYGSLPGPAQVSGIAALQRMAERFSDQQLSTLASECCGALAASDECSRRIATTLCAKNIFVRFAGSAFANASLISELEDAIPALAAKFAVPSRVLVVESRIFLLRPPVGGQVKSAANSTVKTVLAGLIQHLARYIGAQPANVLKELLRVAGNQRFLTSVLNELSPATGFNPTDSSSLADLLSLPKEKDDKQKKSSALSSQQLQKARHHDAGETYEPQLAESQLSRSYMLAGQTGDTALPFSSKRGSVDEDQSLYGPMEHQPREHEPLEYDVRGRLHALGHFLLTGSLPWWAERLARESSRDWLATPLAQHPQLVLNTLRSLGRRPEAVKRLQRHVAVSELEQIIHIASPEYGGFLVLYIYAGELLSQVGDQSVSAALKSRAGAIHWRETLAFILEKHATVPSPKEALCELTIRVSRSLGMAHDCYTACLLHAVQQRTPTQGEYAVLSDMLTQINSAAVTDGSQHPATALTSDTLATSRNNIPSPTSLDLVRPPARAEVPSVNNAAIEDKAEVIPLQEINKDIKTAGLTDDLAELSESSKVLQQLDYLLRYGDLPQDTKENLQRVMAQVEQELQERPTEYRTYLMQAATHEIERKRMARLFSPELLASVWRVMLPSHHADAALCLHAIEEATSSDSTGTAGDACLQTSAEELLRAIVQAQGRRWDGPLFLRSVVRRLAEHLSLRPAVLTERIRAVAGRQPAASQQKLEAILDRVDREMATIPVLPQVEQQSQQNKHGHPMTKTRPPAKQSRPFPSGEPFYIGNAGAVLLWPFLSRYFQELGLLNKNVFSDEIANHRAIHLVQYLVKKEWDAPEHQLLLNKILVGVSPEQPLEVPSALTETEEHLSEQLLQGVLKNWEKLHNTSVQGLRDSFLVREGKLVKKDDAWFLTVSTRGYDVLLDSLPWRFSMVKLPWMKTLLHVKWR